MYQPGNYDYASSYYQQHDQSQFQNPNPNPHDPYTSSLPIPMITHASAPPISPTASFNPQNHDHIPFQNLPPLVPNSNSSSYYPSSYLPSSDYSYDQNQTFLHYDQPSNSAHDGFSMPVPYSLEYNPSGDLNESFGRDDMRYDNHVGFRESVGSDDGVYAYKGSSSVEPYGARGTGSQSQSSGAFAFDDYGRPIRNSNRKDQVGSFGSPGNVTKAIPKSEMQQDVHSGVQKFRVTLLAETGGQRNVDVLCQVGLDGIRMLEHSTSRTLQIYPLETLIKCEVLDSSIFAFWSKTSVDIEPKRIRLKSNSYTTNIILDAVTAATIQLKEMDGGNKPSHPTNVSDQIAEKKKGLGDWINLMKPKDEEKDHWVPDDAVKKCNACGTDFGAFMRRHHCRNCGDIFCDKCTQGRITLTTDEQAQPVRVCDQCMAEVTQRLSNSRAPGQVAGLHRHEDLAKKLQEEMDRKRQTGTKYDGSRLKMREVACPTCTVHLEVEVPSSGSKTIECSVCQHPFLVNAQ